MEYPVQPEIAYDLEKGQKQHAEELSRSLNAHVLHRQKLAVLLEHEFGQVCGGGAEETPEEAAIRLLREQITKLTVANERAALLAEENLNLSNRNNVLLSENAGLREDIASAEEEAARFSKVNRQMSVRSRELLAEVAALKTGDTIDLTVITKAPMTGDSFETFANFFLIEAVVALDRATGKPGDAVAKVFQGKDKVPKAQVRLSINGVVVPFLDVLRRFHADWERCTHARAVQIVQEEFADRTSPIYELLDGLKDQLERQLGVPKDEET